MMIATTVSFSRFKDILAGGILAMVCVGGLATVAAAQATKQQIYDLSTLIRQEVYNSNANEFSLVRVRDQLNQSLNILRGHGGGGGPGDSDLYCRRIRDTSWYAPARISDQEWMDDNGVELSMCQQQISGARNGLICSRIRDTSWYAPKLVTNKEWRGENGLEFGLCDRQVRHSSRAGIFCQRIRDTSWFAPARISTGEWLQDNGVLLDQCLASIGTGFVMPRVAIRSEPKIPNQSSATAD